MGGLCWKTWREEKAQEQAVTGQSWEVFLNEAVVSISGWSREKRGCRVRSVPRLLSTRRGSRDVLKSPSARE